MLPERGRLSSTRRGAGSTRRQPPAISVRSQSEKPLDADLRRPEAERYALLCSTWISRPSQQRGEEPGWGKEVGTGLFVQRAMAAEHCYTAQGPRPTQSKGRNNLTWPAYRGFGEIRVSTSELPQTAHFTGQRRAMKYQSRPTCSASFSRSISDVLERDHLVVDELANGVESDRECGFRHPGPLTGNERPAPARPSQQSCPPARSPAGETSAAQPSLALRGSPLVGAHHIALSGRLSLDWVEQIRAVVLRRVELRRADAAFTRNGARVQGRALQRERGSGQRTAGQARAYLPSTSRG